MSYQKALEAAGAKVIAFQEFGSYQGDWLAKVEYNGVIGWISDYYGSCSGCDAFLREFDFSGGPPRIEKDGTFEDEHYNEITEGEYNEKLSAYNKRLADFGNKYLTNILTFDDVMKVATEHEEWDMEAGEMIAFLNQHK